MHDNGVMVMKNSMYIAAAALGLIAVPASAAVVIDQEAIVPTPPALSRVAATVGDRAPPPGSTAPPLVNAIVGQSVTAGVSGTLEGIELQGPFWNVAQFGYSNAFRLSLFSGDLGAGGTFVYAIDVPVGAALSQTSLNTAATFYVDTSPLAYALNAGDIFSFSVALLGRGNGSGPVTIGNVAGTSQAPIFQYNQYAGGSGYYSNNGAPFTTRPWDVGFRTYVDTVATPAVPEPATWGMMIAGFGALGIAMRRAKRATVTYA